MRLGISIGFSSQEFLVNSSTVRYCIAMERQKGKRVRLCSEPENSGNDRERKNHIDDGERPAATTNDEDGQSRIYEQLALLEIMGFTMALVSCSSALSFSRNRRPRFTHDNDENERISRQSKQSTPKVG